MVASKEGETAAAETLEYTPTFIVAGVCTVIVAASLLLERVLHYGGKYLKKKNQKPLYEALQKIKEELMLLGFISLLLTVLQNVISKICIPSHVIRHMLPCSYGALAHEEAAKNSTSHYQTGAISRVGRKLLSGGGGGANYCAHKGKVPLLSTEALHHLHIFIFVLACVHVTFCVLTILFGGAKIRQWKRWEDAIGKDTYDPNESTLPACSYWKILLWREEDEDTKGEKKQRHECGFDDPMKKVTHVRNHAFIKDHFLGMGQNSALLGWVLSFFKQFYASVTKSDYATLRLGFIMTHCRGNPKFNFHKYMMRALEDDFRVVVGISWYLWIFVVIFLLLNVNGWHTYFWIAFVPFILLLAVGTKLEHVISQLAHEVAEKHIAIEGDLVVQPSDAHFWFAKPHMILFLIHFILFQNAFEIAFFFWILFQYGFDSCIMGQVRYIIPRLIIGVFIQVLCSYSTLPLYAIVTQMGTHYKKSIFDEHMQVGLVGWANKAKKKGLAAAAADSNGSTVGGTSSHGVSTAAKIQLAKFVRSEPVPQEIQPAGSSSEPK